MHFPQRYCLSVHITDYLPTTHTKVERGATDLETNAMQCGGYEHADTSMYTPLFAYSAFANFSIANPSFVRSVLWSRICNSVKKLVVRGLLFVNCEYDVRRKVQSPNMKRARTR